jgi:chromosome segregation ATPase
LPPHILLTKKLDDLADQISECRRFQDKITSFLVVRDLPASSPDTIRDNSNDFDERFQRLETSVEKLSQKVCNLEMGVSSIVNVLSVIDSNLKALISSSRNGVKSSLPIPCR